MRKFIEQGEIISNDGFQEPKLVWFGKKKHWTKKNNQLGADEVIRPDGNWSDLVDDLELEVQNKYFETMHCWIWNTIKAIVLIIYAKWGDKEDYSERYNGVLGGATPNGGSPHEGCESIRKFGLIPQEELPWTPDLNSFWKFSSPRPMLQKYLDIGKEWLRQYTFKHDWVVYPTFMAKLKQSLGFKIDDIIDYNIREMKEALKKSPLGVSVLAWQMRNGKAWREYYQIDNHWTLVVGYVEGQYWIAYDSYRNCWVKLEWRYPFRWVKEYRVGLNDIIQRDAMYIIDKFATRNVKGEKESAVYYIFGGKKHPYKNLEHYYKICDRWFGTREFKVVAQDALDLIEEGDSMDYDRIASIKPFHTIEDSIKK